VSVLASQLELGRKVAEQRRRCGWSQLELADRLGKPVSWVSRLERGLEPAESMPVLQILPGPSDLTGPAAATTDPAAAELARALRVVLDPRPAYRPRSRALALRTTTDQQSLAAEVWDLTVSGQYERLAVLVGDLLPVVFAALRTAPGDQEAGLHQVAAACYQACSAALAKLGDYDGAVLAADRALTAGECADDPVAVAAGAYLLVCILIEGQRYESALAIAAAAAASLRGLATSGSWTAISFRGALTLLSALACVRVGDVPGAAENLSRAKVMAGRLTYSTGERAIGFSADHVALYEIAIRIESAGLTGNGRGQRPQA
jgi:transcriptional regulator with XRE-family HTH domain